MKIGAITIGQAPRVDVTCDIMDIFSGKIELLQRGGLDGLTREEIEKFRQDGITDKELRTARELIKSSIILSLE